MVTLAFGLALIGWILSSMTQLHDRLATVSPAVATGVLVVLIVVLIGVLSFGLRLLWVSARPSAGNAADVRISSDPTLAAAQSIQAAQSQVQLITEEIAQRSLQTELNAVADDFAARRFSIVVFGTGSAGKTSVINALLGTDSGETDPTVGTTQHGQEHTYVLDGSASCPLAEGTMRLIDTPGLSEIGHDGLMREERARELASGADLILFVVDQDIRDIEFAPLQSLARLGKRSLLVFNKRDLYSAEEVHAIVATLGDRLGDVIGKGELVICAADPAAVTVRHADGTTCRDKPPADVGELADRIAKILRQEGLNLLAQNVLLKTHGISELARDSVERVRRQTAQVVVRRFQWTTAGVMFVNPVPGLGALAAAAINYQMITEIAKAFEVSLSVDHAKKLATELGQVLLKMGVVALSTNILGKALKASVAGYVAGGAIEAVAGAYLTRLSGLAFIDYFAHDQSWGDGGIQQAVERKFDLERKSEFVRGFVTEAARRLLDVRDDAGP